MPPLIVLTPGRAADAFLGVQRQVLVADPAAGAEWTFTLPGGSWWRLLLARWRLVTSAAAASRDPGIAIQDQDGTELWAVEADANVPASTTTRVNVSGGLGAGAGASGGALLVPFPDLLLPAGWRIASSTGTIQAADQHSQVRLLFEEIDLGPVGERVGVQDLNLFPATPEG